MAISKVVYDGETLVDLTGDTVSKETLLARYTAHDASGNSITGSVVTVPVDDSPTEGSENAVSSGGVFAAIASHNQAASTITAGTFAGRVVANSSGQAAGTALLRNSKLVSVETNPAVNGEICWTYE